MNESNDDRVMLDQLAEEFAARRRRGETPSLTEYSNRYPHLADEIRDLFPALDVLEQLKPASPDLTADFGKPATETHATKLEQLGDYQVLREIGRGGMGVVYEAEQLSLGRRVAIKVLPSRSLADMALNRFLREARAAAGLHHSNIVPVFGVGKDHGVHYYVMQYIIGLGIDQVLDEVRRIESKSDLTKAETDTRVSVAARHMAHSLVSGAFALPAQSAPSTQRPLPPSDDAPSPSTASMSVSFKTSTRNAYWQSVARIGKQVADALAYAHTKGIVHRDIKPSNLILDDKGIVWVTDFGLAKAMSEDNQLTNAGDIVGTLRYMAPERFQGKSDIRGDLFSLGLTLYEMLTLQPAYQGSDRDSLLEQIREANPPRPRKVRPSIPRDLETIVLKAIDRDPERRYQTGADLADDLQRFLEDRPIKARRTTPVEHLWRWAKRNPVVAGLTSCVALLLVVSTLGASVMSWMLREERNTAKSNEERALKAEEKIKGERDQAMDHLWAAYLAEIRALRLAREPGFRGKALEVARKAAAIKQSLALRNETANLLLSPDVFVVREWENRSGEETWIGTDRQGQRYLRTNKNGDLAVYSVDSNVEQYRLPGPGIRAWDTVFSPSGNFLAVHYEANPSYRMVIWDLRTRTKVWEQDRVWANGWEFSPDDRWFVFVSKGNDASLLDVTEKKIVKTFKHANVRGMFAFDPESKLLVTHQPGFVDLYHVPGLEKKRRIVTVGYAGGVAFSPDGARLAVGRGNDIYLYETANPAAKPSILHGHDGGIRQVYFTRCGDWLISESHDETTKFWDLGPRRCVATLVGLGHAIMPDDRSVFFRSGNRLGVWRFEAGDHFHRLPLWNGNESGVSPDGRWYAYSSPSGLQVYDINARKRAALWLGPGWRGVHFAPDGKSIVASEIPIRVFHWPLRFEGPTGLTLDPPATLLQRYTSHEGGLLAADGTHLAHINVAVVSWHNLQQQRDVYSWADHPNVAGMDVSPDGNWLATGTFHGHSVKVRDLRTGKLARDLRSLGTANVVFSPNSKWLVTCSSDDHCLWETGSWTRLHTFRRLSLGNFASSAVFSPDSKYLAIDPSPNTLQIVDPRTGHEFLTLEMPRYPANSMAKGMTANGDTLIGGVTGNVHGMWDIRGLRERLREMKLDWDDPL